MFFLSQNVQFYQTLLITYIFTFFRKKSNFNIHIEGHFFYVVKLLTIIIRVKFVFTTTKKFRDKKHIEETNQVGIEIAR